VFTEFATIELIISDQQKNYNPIQGIKAVFFSQSLDTSPLSIFFQYEN